MITRMRKPLDASKARREQGKKGFTLTEIAIVLGIVGLILGAIWVAAAAVYNNLRVSRATTELLTIAQNVRAMYATSSAVDPLANMTISGTQSANALTYIQAGIFPSDMVAGGNTVVDPWGGGVAVASATTIATADSFIVSFDRVPQSACISMLTSNTGQGRDSGLFQAQAATGNAMSILAAATLAATTFPLLSSTATTQCTQTTGNLNNVSFAFKLKG